MGGLDLEVGACLVGLEKEKEHNLHGGSQV